MGLSAGQFNMPIAKESTKEGQIYCDLQFHPPDYAKRDVN